MSFTRLRQVKDVFGITPSQITARSDGRLKLKSVESWLYGGKQPAASSAYLLVEILRALVREKLTVGWVFPLEYFPPSPPHDPPKEG